MINIERSENILLIASKFFGYYEMIAEEARAQGYQVDYILDRPSNSNLSKAIGRVNINLIRLSTEKYFRNTVLPQIRGKSYDYVLAVYAVGFALTPEMLSKVRRMNPSARFILYQWDADKNLRFPERIHECFDTVFSFERQDCLQDRERRFLPLFYGHEYAASDDADPVHIQRRSRK